MKNIVDMEFKKNDKESTASCNHIAAVDGEPFEEEDSKNALSKFEEGVKATFDQLKDIDLGSFEDSRPIYVSALFSLKEENAYIKLLQEYRDVFTWSYKEMSCLDLKIVVYHLAVKQRAHPIKQA